MVFEDDSKLLGLLMRYSDPSEIDDLKTEIVKYINTQTQDIKTQMTQYHSDYTADVPLNPDASDPLGDVRICCFNNFQLASPGDSMLEMKKRRRMQAVQKAAAEQKKKEDSIKKQTEMPLVNLAQCDLGASP